MSAPKRSLLNRAAPASAWMASIFTQRWRGDTPCSTCWPPSPLRAFEIPPDRLRDAVRTFTIGKMRGERLERNGVVIWNDCYNSNPEAVRAMLDVLRATPARRRIAVLGEMLELGHAAECLHRQVGRCAAESGIGALIAVRGAARFIAEEAVRAGMPAQTVHFFEDPAQAGEFVRQLAAPGDAILFKGSRGVEIERAMEKILA